MLSLLVVYPLFQTIANQMASQAFKALKDALDNPGVLRQASIEYNRNEHSGDDFRHVSTDTLSRWRQLSQDANVGYVYQDLLEKWSAANMHEARETSAIVEADIHSSAGNVTSTDQRTAALEVISGADKKAESALPELVVYSAHVDQPVIATKSPPPGNIVVYSADLPLKRDITPQELIRKFRELDRCSSADIEFLQSEDISGQCRWRFRVCNADPSELPEKQLWKGNVFVKLQQ
jgi:hypothetical protein